MNRRHQFQRHFATGVVLATCFFVFRAAAANDRGLEIFEKSIRPTLIEHCISCHGPDEQEGGLQLSSRSGWQMGGDSGPAAIPGQPKESLLLKAIRYQDASLEMPPDGKLPAATIAAFEQWIRLGAPDPREAELVTPKRTGGSSVEEGRRFWAFQPLQHPTVPSVADISWPRTNIDRFVLARLETEGMAPSPDVDRNALVRRLYFDLIGLPPTAQQIDAFIADTSADALRELVNDLLASKQFGERWGRHWLDVVRFAESSGGGRTLLFPDAWRYRDYVIDAFNQDLPYDQFLLEQIAGDLLPSDTRDLRSRRLIATAFLLLGPTNYELQDKEILEMDIVDEQLDTIGKSMLGMTIGCARCHDHKFDPIPTRDYYAMAGIFKSTKAIIHENVSVWNKVPLPLSPEEEARIAESEAQIAAKKTELEKVHKQLKARKQQKDNQGDRPTQDAASSNLPQASESTEELDRQVKALGAALKELKSQAPSRPYTMATVDEEKPADIEIAIRGVVHNKGPLVPRGVLQVCRPTNGPTISGETSGRLEFASWIADANNPLTARVMANRAWHWLMRRGIVRTVDNFGVMGERPTHPELLDHLASTFVDDEWSVKRLVRRIVMSRAYQLRAEGTPESRQRDPQNKLLSRFSRRRLEAEEIRDALLQVGGQLDLQYGGPNMAPGTTSEYGYLFESTRRSVYVPVFRNRLPEIFEVFDFADPNIQGGLRNASTIAPQALWFMNHPFVSTQCERAAQRLAEVTDLSRAERIDVVYREVLARPPSSVEAQLAERFVGANLQDQDRWAMLYQTLFQSVDFRYLY